MMKESDLMAGMRVYFVHHPANTDPYVNSGMLTDTQYLCRDPETNEPLWPVETTYARRPMVLRLGEMFSTEEDAGKAVMDYVGRAAT